MPKTTVTTTTEVQLKPVLKRQLAMKLRTYATVKAQIDALIEQQVAIKDELEALFTKAGEMSALQAGIKTEDGFSIKRHVGESTGRLDKKALIEATGITMKDLENATKNSPKKPYIKIHVPGDKNEE